MTSVTTNTFTITGSSQFTEEGFSRIPKKGQHHFHTFVTMSTPNTNIVTQREYAAAAVLDLQHIGPQRLKAFKIDPTEQFWNDRSAIDFNTTERGNTDSLAASLIFSTSLGTELSALEKTVTPTAFDYTSRQYRLISFNSQQSIEKYVDAFSSDATGTGGAGYHGKLPSFNDFKWMHDWVDFRTEPLVVGPQLVVLLDVVMRRGNPIQFDPGTLSNWFIDMDIITEDVSMTAEDTWFARRLFNQDATNRVMYFRFAQTG